MSVAQNWVEALQIDPEKLNEWSSLAPEGVPMLVWCLQEGHVSVEQYLTWATQHFELPVVRAEYFTEAFDSHTALELHKTLSAGEREWTPWFFPVEKWENVTLVACVEPPPDFDQPGFRCVLADARLLKDAWYRFMAPPEAEGVITAPEMPKGMENDQVNTNVKPFKLSLDDLDSTNLFLNKEPDPSELYSPPQEEEPYKPPVPELPGDEKSMVAEVFSAKVTPPVPSEKPAPMDDEVSRMHTHVDLSKLDDVEPEPEAPRAPAPPVPISQKAAAKPPPPAAKSGKRRVVTKLSDKELENLIMETFAQLRGLYKNCFLMRCLDSKAVLYRWDDSIQPSGGGKVSVDLAFPTFFRILHKTNLPYHGYLVDSPAHRTFFSDLKIKDLPGCVTAIPIKDENTLVGVLVCVGDEPLQKLDMLKKAEEASVKLIEAMSNTWSESRAA